MLHRHQRRDYYYSRAMFAIMAIIAALMLLSAGRAFLAPVGAADAPAALVAGEGVVSVYPGPERPGLERRACGFKDGIYIMRGELSAQRVIVTDPINREYYRSQPIPELQGYAVQQLSCVRSAQSGRLVIVVAGFYAGSSGQQSLTLATDYFINEEVRYEEYTGGSP